VYFLNSCSEGTNLMYVKAERHALNLERRSHTISRMYTLLHAFSARARTRDQCSFGSRTDFTTFHCTHCIFRWNWNLHGKNDFAEISQNL